MYISRKTDYGLILIGALRDAFPSGEFVSLKSIAKQYRLPYAYIEKLAGTLKQAGILKAQAGKQGGYKLARKPSAITVQEVVDAFTIQPIMRCLHSPHPEKSCALVSICPTRKGWYKIDKKIESVLSKITVRDL